MGIIYLTPSRKSAIFGLLVAETTAKYRRKEKMTYTRYEIAVNDKSNRFENRIELEELIAKAIQSYGLKVGVDVDVVTTDVVGVNVCRKCGTGRRDGVMIVCCM